MVAKDNLVDTLRREVTLVQNHLNVLKSGCPDPIKSQKAVANFHKVITEIRIGLTSRESVLRRLDEQRTKNLRKATAALRTLFESFGSTLANSYMTGLRRFSDPAALSEPVKDFNAKLKKLVEATETIIEDYLKKLQSQ